MFRCSKSKKDYSRLLLLRKKSPNRLLVDEAVNDNNFVVALHPNTTERLQLFRCPPQGMPHLPDSLALKGPNSGAQVGNLDASLGKFGLLLFGLLRHRLLVEASNIKYSSAPRCWFRLYVLLLEPSLFSWA